MHQSVADIASDLEAISLRLSLAAPVPDVTRPNIWIRDKPGAGNTVEPSGGLRLSSGDTRSNTCRLGRRAALRRICSAVPIDYIYPMPYEWTPERPQATPDWQLSLWPYRSLLRKDFVLFIGATAALVALPLITVLGTAILWGLLPFFALMLGGIWFALHVSYKRGEVLEELTVTDTTAHLTRHNPTGARQDWEANRYWVTVHLHPKGGPVENYITLRGGDREVEIGAFLDAEERLALYDELKRALRPA